MKIDGDNVHSGKRWFYCTSYHKRQHLIDNMSYIPGCIEEKWTFGYISAHLRVITTCWRCRCVRTAMLQCGTLLIYYKPVLQYVLCCWWPGIQCVMLLMTMCYVQCKLLWPWWKRELSDINFEIRKPCQRFNWMLQSSSGRKTDTFSQNVGKVFWSQSWYQRILSFLFMQDPTEKQPLTYGHE